MRSWPQAWERHLRTCHWIAGFVLDEALVALAGHVGGGDHRDYPWGSLGRTGVDGPDHRARMVGEAPRL